jgi:hypothetical protein
MEEYERMQREMEERGGNTREMGAGRRRRSTDTSQESYTAYGKSHGYGYGYGYGQTPKSSQSKDLEEHIMKETGALSALSAFDKPFERWLGK